MKPPDFEDGFIDEAKITDYLLSEENSGGKAAFFFAFVFTLGKPDTLRRALLLHAQSCEAARFSETSHGLKIIIEGELQTPDGRMPWVRSIWIIEKERTAPRFITAYPLEE